MRVVSLSILTVLAFTLALGGSVKAQSFGVETHNVLMPASGGMGGVSIALPQDLTSAINGNPATLTQFYGTQFLFGGAWAEPTYNLAHQQGLLPTLGTFDAKSEAQGRSWAISASLKTSARWASRRRLDWALSPMPAARSISVTSRRATARIARLPCLKWSRR